MNNIKDIINNLESLHHQKGATELDIKKAEKELQLQFNTEYKNYVLFFGAISYANHEITGICSFPRLNVITVTKEEREFNPTIPNDYYVIEQTNIDGIVIWQSFDGSIFQSFSNGTIKKICSSLSEYVLSE